MLVCFTLYYLLFLKNKVKYVALACILRVLFMYLCLYVLLLYYAFFEHHIF